jgi:hypothetical protein
VYQFLGGRSPADTLTLQCSTDGVIKLNCTISKPGMPRIAKFKVKDGKVVFTGELTRGPKPPESPMNADEFSEAALRPFLFPEQYEPRGCRRFCDLGGPLHMV